MLNCKRRRKSEKILWSLSRHGDNSVKTFDSDCYTRTLPQSVTACRLHAGRQHVCRDVRSLWNEFLLRTTWTRTATVVLVQYTVQCLYRLPYLLSTTTSHTERCKLIMSVTVDKKSMNTTCQQTIEKCWKSIALNESIVFTVCWFVITVQITGREVISWRRFTYVVLLSV